MSRMTRMSVLGVVAAKTSYGDGRKSVREVEFQDWTVDGQPLRELVMGPAEPPLPREPTQHMTWLSDAWTPDGALHGLRRLMGCMPGDFSDGRISVLVCPIDGDIDCGALSVELVLGSETVEWRELGWQIGYDIGEPPVELLDPPLTIRFDRQQYTGLLSHLVDTYEAEARSRLQLPQATPDTRRSFWRRR